MRLATMISVVAALLCSAPSIAFAQTAEDAAISKKLEVEHLRLAPESKAFANGKVRIAYVTQDVQPGGGKYFCGALSDARREDAVKDIQQAFARIPASAWEKIQLDYVLLCQKVRARDMEIGGIPVPPLRLLMLATGSQSGNRFAQTGLHELYHLIEMQQKRYQDAFWNDYFTGYAGSYQDGTDTAFGSGGKGFLNAYSKTFAHEERAEIFSSLLFSSKELQQHIAKTNDEQLMQKVGYMVGKCQEMLGTDACR